MSITSKSKIKHWNLSYSIYKYCLWVTSIVDTILVTNILEEEKQKQETKSTESHIIYFDKILFSVAGLQLMLTESSN